MNGTCFVVCAGCAALVLFVTAVQASGEESRSLLANPDGWQAIASEGVKVKLTPETTKTGKAIRIDFDFTSGAGYGGMYLPLPIELPENYEIALTLRGEGPANNLELKLTDPEVLNVWWVNRRAFEWPAEAMRLSNQRRHFQFAWGPSGGKPLTKLGRIELIIAAAEGGKGTVWLEDIRFTPLPPAKPYTGTPSVSASSGADDAEGLQNVLSAGGGRWTPDAGDRAPWLAIDFGEPRELGGLVVSFTDNAAPGDFGVQTSDDGKSWQTVRKLHGASGLPGWLMLTDLHTRHLRFAFARESPRPSVARVEVLDTSAGASANTFWKHRAVRAPRGTFPRTLLDEQSFWTVIGQPGDDREALINQEGQIEVDRRGFSIEPFLINDGKLLTWADGAHEQSLHDGWMPIPTVTRKHEGLELSITAMASGPVGESDLHVAYTVTNTGTSTSSGKLALAVRPFQVLPPWQDLNITGGWTPIRTIRVEPDGLVINNDKRLVTANRQFSSAAFPYDAGDPIESLKLGRMPVANGVKEVNCLQRSASGLLAWDYSLPPRGSATFVISVPFHGIGDPADRLLDGESFDALERRVASDWTTQVDRVTFRLPPEDRQFHDTIRATQAYILINHDAPGFQPGSRTYNRSWMRDGSMTSAAMLELGHEQLVREFLDWYAPYQFPSGKVPCVVDRRGADPVPEHDSNGQLIWLIANTYRYTGDIELAKKHFPRVKATVDYIESLRAERMTNEFGPAGKPRQEPGKPPVPASAFRGLVPESISHEGYSAKPMHSFWDTFFILRGLKDAAFLAQVVGETELAKKWNALADEFRQSLIDSIKTVHAAHGIDYLPGCVELGDFDSTSSTILLWPVDEASRFPRSWIDATFDRYWREFSRRRDESPAKWEAYTPYELRHVNALVRLGQRERAWEVLNWYMGHQRPSGWRHWAEVVWRDPNAPRMIGDMPHTWCGSDFLNAARTMFVFEEDSTHKLVLFAGVPEAWLTSGHQVGFDTMRTEFGAISASATSKGAAPANLVIELSGSARPPGGFELRPPAARRVGSVRVNGRDVTPMDDGSIRFDSLPTRIEISTQ